MASRNQFTAPLLQAGAVPDAARAAVRDSRLPAAASDRRLQRDSAAAVRSQLTMMLAHVNSSLLDAQRTLQRRSAVLAQYDAALSRLRGPRRRRISRDDLERLPLERIAGEALAALRPIRIVDDSEFAVDWMVCAGDDPEPEAPVAQRMPSGDDTALVELIQRHFQAESRKRQIGRGHVEAALELRGAREAEATDGDEGVAAGGAGGGGGDGAVAREAPCDGPIRRHPTSSLPSLRGGPPLP